MTSQEAVLRYAPVYASMLAAAFAVSCSASPEDLTAPQFVDRANAICLAAGQPYAGQRPTRPDAFLDFLRSQIPAQAKGLKALEALRPPVAARRAWSKQVLVPERDQLSDSRAAVAKLEDQLRRGDAIAASALVLQTTDRLDARGTGINRYWLATGMRSCLDSPL